ncbi:MAG: hypothetical protein J7J16_04615 [Deltaproteobacteria bacterium]|nr:hypothetical protein [Deltaproteobacteria bacterium]
MKAVICVLTIVGILICGVSNADNVTGNATTTEGDTTITIYGTVRTDFIWLKNMKGNVAQEDKKLQLSTDP